MDNTFGAVPDLSTEPPTVKVNLVDDAYRLVHELAPLLAGANRPEDVVLIGLSVLRAARGKRIQLVSPDGQTQAVNIWKQP